MPWRGESYAGEWDPRDDAWFSGFAAGESYFQLRRQNNRGWRIEPRFRIHLRADDLAILDALQAAFGGSVRRGRNGIWLPQAHWLVSRKQDLQQIVDYFDRFPLRAKKAREYVVWREAVVLYIAASGVHPHLFELSDRLLREREFVTA
jgi:hypothetical protein